MYLESTECAAATVHNWVPFQPTPRASFAESAFRQEILTAFATLNSTVSGLTSKIAVLTDTINAQEQRMEKLMEFILLSDVHTRALHSESSPQKGNVSGF